MNFRTHLAMYFSLETEPLAALAPGTGSARFALNRNRPTTMNVRTLK